PGRPVANVSSRSSHGLMHSGSAWSTSPSPSLSMQSPQAYVLPSHTSGTQAPPWVVSVAVAGSVVASLVLVGSLVPVLVLVLVVAAVVGASAVEPCVLSGPVVGFVVVDVVVAAVDVEITDDDVPVSLSAT